MLDYGRRHDPVDGDVVEQAKVEHVEARQVALTNRDSIRSLDDTILCAKVLSLTPSRGVDKALAAPEDFADMLHFCLKHRRLLNQCSPALFVEDALSDARLVNPSRRPRASDTADLFHSMLGLAYVGFFVSQDRWVMDCAHRAKETVFRFGLSTAALLSSLDELSLALDEG